MSFRYGWRSRITRSPQQCLLPGCLEWGTLQAVNAEECQPALTYDLTAMGGSPCKPGALDQGGVCPPAVMTGCGAMCAMGI